MPKSIAYAAKTALLRLNYSYSVYLWHHYSAEYEYTIQLTIRTE